MPYTRFRSTPIVFVEGPVSLHHSGDEELAIVLSPAVFARPAIRERMPAPKPSRPCPGQSLLSSRPARRSWSAGHHDRRRDHHIAAHEPPSFVARTPSPPPAVPRVQRLAVQLQARRRVGLSILHDVAAAGLPAATACSTAAYERGLVTNTVSSRPSAKDQR